MSRRALSLLTCTLMSTLPGDGTTKWNWVVYAIPASTISLARGGTGGGTNSGTTGAAGAATAGVVAKQRVPPDGQGAAVEGLQVPVVGAGLAQWPRRASSSPRPCNSARAS